jgi:tRNA(fMet)-specific endonuclease VapC
VRYVLDTNVVIAALNGVDEVAARLRNVPLRDVGIPLVVIGELAYGAHKSPRKRENLARVDHLRATFPIVPVTEAIIDRYASIRAALEVRGIVKTDFDLIIACSALEAGATLVTHDAALKDGSIERLTVDDWLDGSGAAHR